MSEIRKVDVEILILAWYPLNSSDVIIKSSA